MELFRAVLHSVAYGIIAFLVTISLTCSIIRNTDSDDGISNFGILVGIAVAFLTF